ncbi:MAG TPA: hypothetical protein VNK50_04360 [Calidithermus sp.]|nr:hypothetical protein [Calidithermus sp.]
MPRPTAPTRLGHLLVLAAFVSFVVGLAPHLVHHLFDSHTTAAGEECPFAAAGDRTPPAAPSGPSLTTALQPVWTLSPVEPAAPATLAAPPSEARAPPHRA